MTGTTLNDGNSPETPTPTTVPESPGRSSTAPAGIVSHRFSRCQRTGDCDRDYHDCARPLFDDAATNGRWYMYHTRSKVWIWVREPSGDKGERVIAKLDLDMWDQAKRICDLMNATIQSASVFVRGKAGDGVETLKEWYDRTASGARGSLHPHLPGARIWIDEHRYACEDDHVVVWLETDKGCWGPGFHANWCSPAWEVIKTAIELAARHVGELVACGTAKAPAAIESGLHP